MYSVGDKVTIRPDLKEGQMCGGMNVVSSMMAYLGDSAIIIEAEPYCYHIDLDDGRYGWTDDMFAGHKDKALERLLSLDKGLRGSLAKQLIFDCAMELLYRAEKTPDDVLSNKLMNALQALDKEDE